MEAPLPLVMSRRVVLFSWLCIYFLTRLVCTFLSPITLYIDVSFKRLFFHLRVFRRAWTVTTFFRRYSQHLNVSAAQSVISLEADSPSATSNQKRIAAIHSFSFLVGRSNAPVSPSTQRGSSSPTTSTAVRSAAACAPFTPTPVHLIRQMKAKDELLVAYNPLLRTEIGHSSLYFKMHHRVNILSAQTRPNAFNGFYIVPLQIWSSSNEAVRLSSKSKFLLEYL